MADRSLIKITKKGKVKGIEEAVEAVADSHPFVVSDDDEAPHPFKPPATKSGKNPSNKNNKPKGYDMAVLAKRFPALRSRLD